MYFPQSHPWAPGDSLGTYLERRGVSRRDFLTYCAQMTAILGLADAMAPRVAHALATVKRPTVIWLSLQECTGCVESVLRTADPTIGDLLLDVVSLDYQHNIMAAAGHQAEAALQSSMAKNKGDYLLVVTGSVPLNDGGIYTTVGGRTAKTILEEAAKNAKAALSGGAGEDRESRIRGGRLRARGQHPGVAAQSDGRGRGVRHRQGQAGREHRR